MNKEININGKKIVYRVYGKGKPVVLVHGFGETGEIWKTQVDFLKDKYQLIVPDLPGSGQSEMIDDMSMEGMAEVMKRILSAEGSPPPQTPPKEGLSEDSSQKEKNKIIESSKAPSFGGGWGEAALIGHSMGGYITLAFAEKYPDHLTAFGLFHSTAFADSEEKKEVRRKGIEFVKEHGAYEFLKTSIPNLFTADSKLKMAGTIDELVAKSQDFLPAAIIAYYEAMIRRPDRTAILKNAQVPVLFIIGEHDNAIPMQDVLKQSHLPERAHIHILHQSGHMGMLEEPTMANELLQQFLLSLD